jgi:hypothetical protein
MGDIDWLKPLLLPVPTFVNTCAFIPLQARKRICVRYPQQGCYARCATPPLIFLRNKAAEYHAPSSPAREANV